MKHSRSITAAASIQSRRILASLSDLSLFSSSTEILVSSRSSMLDNVWLSGAVFSASAGFRSPRPWRLLSGSIFLLALSCGTVLSNSNEASWSQISRLTWKWIRPAVIFTNKTSGQIPLDGPDQTLSLVGSGRVVSKFRYTDPTRPNPGQPISCFLRWQSSHRRRYRGRYGSHQENREILDPIFSIQVRAYRSRKSRRHQFHNSYLYFRTRPPNLCSHRRCERDFILIPTHFYHATTLQLHAFARHSISWHAGLMTIRHFDLSYFLLFNPGDLYYVGY